jgi:hypothetical protein
MHRIIAGVATAAVGVLMLIPAGAAVAQGKHGGGATNGPQMGCTLSGTGVGGLLTVTASGLAPGSSYIIDWMWPNGAGEAGTASAADSSGHLSYSLYANWAGSYTTNVSSGGKVLASCSTTVS